ncbi:flagellar filament capping protein FliD [Paenibacillus sp. CF384]|uniref:flagellar filament capping protein FliD n=1 Tax=Paenibacillus sp. CF384 TaxID=1884382 RepID=UPI00089914BF|nr:flagellar filament capping protein FliD [Paenibacillus sp. CF384]SDW48906.1 Flagellar capping protein FliD [Paenibacillus sp. CF384]
MVMPYAIPAVFGTVRRTQEPIIPVERYALYPNFNSWPFARQQQKAPAGSGNLLGSIGSFGMPRQAQDTLKAAAGSSAAWLAQGNKLKAAVTDMMLKDKTAFGNRIVAVSNSVDNGKVAGHAAFGAERTSYDIQVVSVAQAQKNISFDLTKNAPSIMSAGTHTFTIQAGNEVKTYTAFIKPGETNDNALGKLRDTINSVKLGVTAFVREDRTTGTVKLELASDHTGKKSSFEIKDLQGDLVAASGIGRTAVNAADARYRINGESYIDSSSNDISLQQGKVTVSLAKLDAPADFTIFVEHDVEAVAKQLSGIVDEINTLQSIYEDASGYLNPMLRNRIEDAVQSSGADVIGLSRNGDGRLKLDQEKLETAMQAKPDEVKRLLSGRSSLTSRLKEALDRFTGLPTEALISSKAGGFQSFTLYGASSKSYLQLPLGGLYVNSFM